MIGSLVPHTSDQNRIPDPIHGVVLGFQEEQFLPFLEIDPNLHRLCPQLSPQNHSILICFNFLGFQNVLIAVLREAQVRRFRRQVAGQLNSRLKVEGIIVNAGFALYLEVIQNGILGDLQLSCVVDAS